MPMTSPDPAAYVDLLSREYERLHVAKEDAFWASYMGLTGDPGKARSELNEREVALNRFLQEPARLKETREQLAHAEANGTDDATRVALRGWVRTFEAHVIESAEARALAEEIVEFEGKLANARGGMELGYRQPGGTFVPASSNKLAMMITTEKDEALRRAAWEGLQAIEPFVLEHGFLDLVKKRNRLGRLLGGEDYYDGKVRRVEGLTKAQIFELLDDLEARTRDSAKRSLDGIRASKGESALEPWNLRHAVAGDVVREQDPYFSFASSFRRWGRSFAALGIRYRGATLVLDLLDRKGKYENGFMHGPEPAWRERGTFKPARIQFTANAIPGQIGSGVRATQTFFHEGGHAAHFANVDMPAPCFGQEFAPTSVAFAEVQSMFLDSLLGDADWQRRYAARADGEPMPLALIEKAIRTEQLFASNQIRAMFTIPYCERAIYELPEGELTAERVLAVVREVEKRLLFLPRGSTRPALSVPHLLAGESSAYYHGYVMAQMGVEQTREHFLRRDGHLMDNARVGPDLAATYWKPGNSRTFFEFIEAMTGDPVSAAPLARNVNRTVEEAIAEAHDRIRRAGDLPESASEGIDLDATIRIVDGNEEIASTASDDFAHVARKFAAWIDARAGA